MPRWRASAVILLLALTGCTPRDFVMGAGAGVGTAAMQERGLEGATSDYNLRLLLNDAFFKDSLTLYQRVSFLISNGRIVMVGRVNTPMQKEHATILADRVTKRAVLNRLTVGDDLSWTQKLADDSASAQLRGTLIFDRDVSAINYDMITRGGVMYIIGESRSESESRRVRYLAEHISGIDSVETFFALPQQQD